MIAVPVADRRLTDEEREFAAANLGLVHLAAIRAGLGDDDDAIQHGVEYLMRAVKMFDPSRGVAFSTYGYRTAASAMKTYRATRGLVRVPKYHLDGGSALPGAREKYRAYVQQAARIDSIHRGPDDDGWTDGPTVRDPDAACDAELRETLWAAVARLPGRHGEVVTRRAVGETLRSIGESMGLTRERVRQIERDALAALRGELVAAGYDGTEEG